MPHGRQICHHQISECSYPEVGLQGGKRFNGRHFHVNHVHAALSPSLQEWPLEKPMSVRNVGSHISSRSVTWFFAFYYTEHCAVRLEPVEETE